MVSGTAATVDLSEEIELPPRAVDDQPEKVNILVVDDRAENVLALQAVLCNPSYNVVTASSGSECLKKILRYEFAVVLLDVLMPTMGGFETARLIFDREASRNVPIIFLTASGHDNTAMREGYSVGAVDYLIKPIEPEIVKAKVAVFVDLFRKSKQILRAEEKLRAADRAHSEQVLSEREAEYEATFEKAAVGIAHVAINGRCLRTNQKFCDIIGYSKQEALRLRLGDVACDEDAASQADGLATLLSGALQDFHTEGRFRHKSGRIVRVDLTVSLLRDVAGKATKFIAVIEDSTARKRVEEGQQVLAEVSKIFLDSHDFKPTLALASRSVVPLLADWCVVDLLAKEGPTEISAAHLDPQKATRLQAVLRGQAGNSSWGAARVLLTQRTQLIPEVNDELLASWATAPDDLQALRGLDLRSVIIAPMKARGALIGAITLISSMPGRRYSWPDVTIAEDLAHRVALGIENARLHKQTQDAIGARDEFLLIASHELLTPLTPLQMQVEQLLRGKPGVDELPREQLRAILERSSVQVRRLASLIDSLLDVSRITYGRLSLEIEEVDLSELANEVVGRFSELAASAGNPLTLHTTGPAVGHCDRLRIEQVLTNLLANAIKYGAGKPIEVRVAVDRDNGVLTVSDQGIGIAAEQVAIIFDRFERGEAARSYGGLGLGLYIARQVVDAHGGSLRAVSEPKHGSVFTVEIPLRKNAVIKSPIEPAIHAALLVEDEAEVC